MFASKHPFRDTLVIEIDAEEILALHGELVTNYDFDSANLQNDKLVSILEAFRAGTDMSRFARPFDCGNCKDPGCTDCFPQELSEDPADDQLAEAMRDMGHPYKGMDSTAANDMAEARLNPGSHSERVTSEDPWTNEYLKHHPTYRNHGEEIDDVIKTHSEINKGKL